LYLSCPCYLVIFQNNPITSFHVSHYNMCFF
jgi:hypothetical protein